MPPIYVTRPYLPPIDEFLPLLREIWTTRVLTNQGPFHQELEAKLCAFLEVSNLSLTANGMLALSAAVDAAALSGEVITTPYSFVATSHAAKIGQLEPVFVDIKEGDLNIDPEAIEAAVTPRTSAILAVHCYGNPCDVDAINAIARRHGLTVIYDAAHAFGVRHRGQGLLSQGDFAALSFHATKAFNTFEGGAVICNSAADKQTVDRNRNFGITEEAVVTSVGGNAKMSEFNAALGLVQLEHFEEVRRKRAAVDARYREALSRIDAIDCLAIPADTEPNFSYFPILVRPGFPVNRDGLHERLAAAGIISRRYFYPLLSNMAPYRSLPSAANENLTVANRIAEQILCLPIFPDLSVPDQMGIIAVIEDVASKASNRP